MTRGIRNRNPLNIRHNKLNRWRGMSEEQTAPAFVQFDTMVYGYRAALIVIRNYIKKGYNTIEKIITRFAPPMDHNNTQAYIEYVCHHTGIGGREGLSIDDPRIKNIVGTMAMVESGKDIRHFIADLNEAADSIKN